MDSRLLLKSAAGIEYTWHEDSDRAVIESSIDVEPLLGQLAERRALVDGTKMGDGMEFAGSVPINIFYELREKHTNQFNVVDREAFQVACLNWLHENGKFRGRTTMTF